MFKHCKISPHHQTHDQGIKKYHLSHLFSLSKSFECFFYKEQCELCKWHFGTALGVFFFLILSVFLLSLSSNSWHFWRDFICCDEIYLFLLSSILVNHPISSLSSTLCDNLAIDLVLFKFRSFICRGQNNIEKYSNMIFNSWTKQLFKIFFLEEIKPSLITSNSTVNRIAKQ